MHFSVCNKSTCLKLLNYLLQVLLTKGDIGLTLVDIESFAAVAWMSQASPKCSETVATNCVKIEKSCQKDIASLDTLNCDLSKLSLVNNVSDADNKNDFDDFECSESSSSSSDSCSDYEICSSCSSHSSDSTFSTFESSESCDENDGVEV